MKIDPTLTPKEVGIAASQYCFKKAKTIEEVGPILFTVLAQAAEDANAHGLARVIRAMEYPMLNEFMLETVINSLETGDLTDFM